MTKKLDILLVEDNAEFREGASTFFKTKSITPVYAGDFLEFDYLMHHGAFDGVITDCFFPYQTGSEFRDKGFEAIEKMKVACPFDKTPISEALWRAYRVVGEEGLRLFCKNAHVDFDRVADYYLCLDMAVKKSEANQPLGILVAEAAEQRRIPFVLATSTYHHDALTQPIQNYCGRKGWTLVDCGKDSEHQKASPEFWARAYSELERRMEKVK